MNLSRFFIDRPIFAGVLSALILIAGLVALPQLPVAEYPQVVPPTVIVNARFPGASPAVIAETVATPIEEAVNGVENMLYMSSQSTSDGLMTLTVTFQLGTDPDLATQWVKTRVDQAEARLPDDVRRLGVTTIKSTPDLTLTVHLYSPGGRYDMAYLHNYALLHVRDRLARIPGVGQVQIRGAGDYSMRVWLDPQKMASRGLAASDVVAAIRAENVQAAAGIIGATPNLPTTTTQLQLNVQGRLRDEQEFGDIIVRTGADGAVTRLRDVARIELGAAEYASRALMDNQPAAALFVLQAPGSNTVQIGQEVRQAMAALKQDMPDGVDYRIVFDPTQFVTASIDAVVHTLFEAVLLVVLVVIVFLQTWRASVIPLVAVPVSIIGTFAVMHLLGFSINTLTLFGLVLSIGIVVDDAIVVVENIERNIAAGLSPHAAANRAMGEVTGPIVAIALVLAAVFVPLAFAGGLTGQFYRQFALTIAISTMISALNSLTLSPALGALLLRPHDAPRDALTRAMDRVLGRPFAAFNRLFERSGSRYGTALGGVLRRRGRAMAVYGLLLALAAWLLHAVPGGFVPLQDRTYLIVSAQLPDGATLDRTEAVIRRIGQIALKDPDVRASLAFPGQSINGLVNSSNAGVAYINLRPFAERAGQAHSAAAVRDRLTTALAAIPDARILIFPPPPVRGLGSTGGFRLQIQDRAALGNAALDAAVRAFIAEAEQQPELSGLFSSFQINVPQLAADVDRARARQLGVAIPDIFSTLQVYLGSQYVNDFNRFGRTYTVRAQADAAYRATAEDVGALQVRSASGQMVPLSALLQVRPSAGPERAMRYNGFPTADVSGTAATGYSSGQAQATIERVAAATLPPGIAFEWTDLTYQQILAGHGGLWIFPLAVLLVFLVLAALYESLLLPLSILLIVPMGALAALAGIALTGGDNNIFTQIGLVVLIGLSAKNAILIVEFARELELAGHSPLQAALQASRLRLRPILMTSCAFIMGVVPLLLSTGAGFEIRRIMGVAVFSGMVGVTLFGVFLTPVFYVLMRALGGNRPLVSHGPVVAPVVQDGSA
ncbi:multidrug efflux RND transporter permease subunit [Stenotrophomonas sp. 24(2023)]|uniref:efflux RND transporter permease subunit n=1 Tax=Stenotrophomonas sp. 24(2023) TaxID=3068324 RepID=UPI0027E14735|nr:multidrug efflux RND transporter permease subunit [Stenotrophomonas sp. 24(2023)]WMJ70838.1 multidrug efflux RND transporter permease subunit [Stenotrophomonas sp. 24(2023)]